MADLRGIMVWMAIAVSLLYLVLGGLGTYFYLDATHKRQEIARQADKQDSLTQSLCKSYNRNRIVGNRTLREPLRYVLEATADSLSAAGFDPGNPPQARAIYLSRAKGLRDRANLVASVRPIKCEFGE